MIQHGLAFAFGASNVVLLQQESTLSALQPRVDTFLVYKRQATMRRSRERSERTFFERRQGLLQLIEALFSADDVLFELGYGSAELSCFG